MAGDCLAGFSETFTATGGVPYNSTTGSLTPTAGTSYMLIVLRYFGSAPTTVTDNKSNGNYNSIAPGALTNSSDGDSCICYVSNGPITTGGSGWKPQFTFASTTTGVVECHELTGLAAASVLDGTPAGNYDTTSPYGQSLTTGNATDLLVSVLGSNSTSATASFTPSGSYTLVTGAFVDGASTALATGVAKQHVTSTGSYDPSWTVTSSSKGLVFNIAFKDAASGGTNTTKIMTETVTLADTTIIKVVRLRTQTDTLSVTDGFFDWLRRVRDQIDTTVLSDGDTYRFSIVTGTDTLDLIDGFVKSLTGAGFVYAKVMSDSITVIDNTGQRWTLRASRATDSIALSDVEIDVVTRIRQLTDTADLSDGIVKIGRLVRVAEDHIDIPDEIVRMLVLSQLYGVEFKFGHTDPIRFGGN